MSETPEHGREPVPGLPAFLPEGERILWQGKPSVMEFAIRALHLRKVAIYFAVLLVLRIVEQGALSGHSLFVLLSLAGLGLLLLLAWLQVRSTLYTITNRRVVLRFGLAMPISFNLPFSRVETLDVRHRSAAATDISIGVRANPQQRLSYIVMWPHARPWRLGNVQPMMRCIEDGEAVADLLQEALLKDVDKEQVRKVVKSSSATDADGGRRVRPKYEPFPRAPLYGAAALIAFSLISVAALRFLDAPAPRAPIVDAVASVQLHFEDRPGGAIGVFDAQSGQEIGELAAGSDNFLRATLRGLVRGRDAMKASEHSAFGLYQLQDGRLLLVDAISGREVDLWAFGKTNATSFARFLPAKATHSSNNISRTDSYESALTEVLE